MNSCAIHDAGTIELYFYGEIGGSQRIELETHLRQCRVCADALGELRVIRDALASRHPVDAPASGDWSAFMARLDTAVRTPPGGGVVVSFVGRQAVSRRPFVGLLATAALLTIVAISVFFASQAGREASGDALGDLQPTQLVTAGTPEAAPIQAGMASVGARHLERSKLVVLGLATKELSAGEADWTYERELATSLLNDTRLYRMAAEQRGLTSLAGVMRDLELVLLQTSMAAETDETALPQIQRLIRKRGLVEKMDVVGTTGLVP